jgi:hypothetical protein
MRDGSILFVHGTGVRLKSYAQSFDSAKKAAAACGLKQKLVECAWGDPLGIDFQGKSLPDPPSEKELASEQQDFAQWSWLFDDPLFELDKLTIRDTSAPSGSANPKERPKWEILWNQIGRYQPSSELQLLLDRGALSQFWPSAWSQVMVLSEGLPKRAFESSAPELAEATHALARALVAALHVRAVRAGASGPSRTLRNDLVNRLLADWGQKVYGLGTFLVDRLKRAATAVLRDHRNDFSDEAALPIGDILLYQARGEPVREFIRKKIATECEPPVMIVAHSLGGIACVDLLALPQPPAVAALVTAGSQAPLLYEIGALFSIKSPNTVPQGFPPWLNIFDRNDFLSYFASRLLPATDLEVFSGQPFPNSHSAYFGNPTVWDAIKNFPPK